MFEWMNEWIGWDSDWIRFDWITYFDWIRLDLIGLDLGLNFIGLDSIELDWKALDEIRGKICRSQSTGSAKYILSRTTTWNTTRLRGELIYLGCQGSRAVREPIAASRGDQVHLLSKDRLHKRLDELSQQKNWLPGGWHMHATTSTTIRSTSPSRKTMKSLHMIKSLEPNVW